MTLNMSKIHTLKYIHRYVNREGSHKVHIEISCVQLVKASPKILLPSGTISPSQIPPNFSKNQQQSMKDKRTHTLSKIQ